MEDVLNKLPHLTGMDKQKIMALLLEEEYGILPSSPHSVTATVEANDMRFCGGKAELKTLRLHCKATWGDFSFPVYYVCPKERTAPVPCFLHINFRDLIPDRYQPTEELVDEGVATLTFCYQDVSSDSGDFTDGLAGVVYPEGVRADNQCGKIGLWAWAACAIMDYAQTLPELDHSKISVIGHSRLGKTALLAGAVDERFFCAFSNDSGCSGAALSRDNTGERLGRIVEHYPYWFCENYKKYAGREDMLPFDQHYLIAANAPHRVYVASALEDGWACPKNEYLSCVAASEYYENIVGVGFVHPNRLPAVGELFHDGKIAYHLRAGDHYLSREDWHHYIEYVNAHKG